MTTRISNVLQQPFRKNVSFMFVVYWAVLVFWQNVGGAQARSYVDMVLKIGLLTYFSWFYLRSARKASPKILWVFLLALSLLMTAWREESFPLGNIISYAYPVVFLTMVYGLGDYYEIQKVHLISFCNCIIAITLYSAIYAIIFCTDQFTGALSISSAYGNELTSFFLSSHEYGLYLLAAIVACLICLKLIPQITQIKKAYYIFAMIILIFNLILTYSRTSIFAMAFFLVIYTLLGKGSLKRWLIAAIVVSAVAVLVIPELSQFFYNIVLKGNQLGDRARMYSYAIEFYQEGSFYEKLFGYGVNRVTEEFADGYGHSSVHNAYLQILLNYGAFGFTFLLGFLATQALACVRTIKKDRFIGTVSLGLCVAAAAMMFTNTTIAFSSPIDSYFLTIFMFVVPKYVRNAVMKDRFD